MYDTMYNSTQLIINIIMRHFARSISESCNDRFNAVNAFPLFCKQISSVLDKT